MPKDCEHNIPETLKGAGACEIRWEVLKRNGKPNWWCRTHGLEASAPDGSALSACTKAWLDPVPPERQHEVDVTSGELAVWAALPPTLQFGVVPREAGRVHVHHRAASNAPKDIDASFDIVRLKHGERELVIESMAATAFSITGLADRTMSARACPRCDAQHIDELRFATFPHRKHQCNACGRHFWDKQPSISNPLAAAYSILDLPLPPKAIPANRPLLLTARDYAGVAIWPSNAAIVSTMSRSEEIGVHVHAWNEGGGQVLDETYAPVSLDGILIDERALRWLAVQQHLAHGAPIWSVPCAHCGLSLTSPSDSWIRPVTTHTCPACDGITKTRRRVFLNPLAEKLVCG